MSDLSDDAIKSIERSLGGPGNVLTSRSETCRMLAELQRRRAADLSADEHTVLGWIRGLAMTWNGIDADKGRAVLDKLCAASLANLTARGVNP